MKHMMKKAAAAVMSLAMIASAGAAVSTDVLKEMPALSASAAGYRTQTLGGVKYRIYDDHVEAEAIAPGYHVVTIRDQVDDKNVTKMDLIGFSHNSDLWNLYIKATHLEKLNNNQFKNCFNLATVELPQGLVEIGESAFEGCSLLREINIPASVEYIRKGAFEFCSNLRSITFSYRTKYIGEYAFYDCDALKKIVFMRSKCETIFKNSFNLNGRRSDLNGPGKAKVYLPDASTSNKLYKYFKGTDGQGHYNYDIFSYKLGDANTDGFIDKKDANKVRSAYAAILNGNSTGLNAVQTVNADVTGDGKITIEDEQLITRYLNDQDALTLGMAAFSCAFQNHVSPWD